MYLGFINQLQSRLIIETILEVVTENEDFDNAFGSALRGSNDFILTLNCAHVLNFCVYDFLNYGVGAGVA